MLPAVGRHASGIIRMIIPRPQLPDTALETNLNEFERLCFGKVYLGSHCTRVLFLSYIEVRLRPTIWVAKLQIFRMILPGEIRRFKQ